MNQRQAGNVLRRNSPSGEFPAFINPREASWLKGMGGKGKKTKSGLRSYALPDANPLNAYDDPNTLSGGAVPTVPTIPTPEGGNGVSTIPNPLVGGSDTRTPAGPGSVTNPNDPHGTIKKISEGANTLIDKEYVAPTLTPEERIAATSADTTAAHDIVRGTTGTGQDEFSDAADVGSDVSKYASDKVGDQSFLSGKGVDQYMSPHTANVIGGMQDNAMRTMQKQRGALQAQHQMAGAGMGSRGALENAAMMGEVQRGLGQQVAGALEDSYAQASDMKKYDMTSARDADKFNVTAGQTDQDIKLRGAKGMVDATKEGRDASYTDAGMLSNVGAYKEGRDQNVIDETMGDFYEERDWGENKLASAANIASTNPTGSTTTTTGAPQHKKRDKFGNIIAGAASGWLASGGNPWGAAVGGGMAAMDW